MSKECLVTVICNTYNHEKYIKDALDGFVIQKTNFRFKVIVQDDASIDKTAEIVKEYESKYPELFDNIYHLENQYQKKVNKYKLFIYPKIEGKYIAYCEGDDYWTDENKLQIIVDYLEKNDNCTLCFHGYNKIRANDKLIISKVMFGNDFDVCDRDVIMYRKPAQLASCVFRKEVLTERPDFFYEARVGDFPLMLNAMYLGRIHYINKNMSSYRVLADGSWSQRVYSDPKKQNEHNERLLVFFSDFMEYSGHKFDSLIDERINEIKLIADLNSGNYASAKKNKLFENATKTEKIEVYLGLFSPYIAKTIKNIYRKIKYYNRVI